MTASPQHFIGKTFDRLTVSDFAYRKKYAKGTKLYWNCVCSCGNTLIVDSSHLGSGHTRSCGCLKQINNESQYNDILCAYKQSARLRNIEFALPLNVFLELIKDDCYYCGAPPSNFKQRRADYDKVFYSGIDRVDNDKGYVLGNVVTCCIDCNHAKMALNQKQFIALCRRVVARHTEHETSGNGGLLCKTSRCDLEIRV